MNPPGLKLFAAAGEYLKWWFCIWFWCTKLSWFWEWGEDNVEAPPPVDPLIEPIPVVLVAAEIDELLEAIEEFAGEDVTEELGRFEFIEAAVYCDPTAERVVEVTLLADRSKTDIRLRGLNFGVSLKRTVKTEKFYTVRKSIELQHLCKRDTNIV